MHLSSITSGDHKKQPAATLYALIIFLYFEIWIFSRYMSWSTWEDFTNVKLLIGSIQIVNASIP